MLSVCPLAIFAQGEMDALKMAQTDIMGTARFMSMGGAFGALGGDASAVGVNPAGLGIYRKSEVSVTPSVNINRTESSTPTNIVNGSRNTFNVNNLSAIFNFKGNGNALKYSSFGFTYNRRTNFRRGLSALYNNSPVSVSDYMALRTNELNIKQSDLGNSKYVFSGDIPYLSDLAWQSYMIDATNSEDKSCTTYKSFLPEGELTNSAVRTKEKGGINQMDFAYGANVGDILFLGASLGLYNINYTMESYYSENFEKGGYFLLDNKLTTTGVGVDFKIGTIVAPVDFLRIGFAFHTPTWYNLEDDARFSAEYDTGEKRVGNISKVFSITEYDYRTPYKIVASLGFVIAKKAILSADYEMSDFSKIEFDTPDNGHRFESPISYWSENDLMAQDFQKKHTLRLGAEFRVTENFSLRLGYSYCTSPVKEALENDLNDKGERANTIYTAGTTTAYSIPQDNMYFSGGFGYSKDFFFVDFAYALNYQKENYYMYFDKSAQMKPVDLTTKRHFAVCTLGFRF